MNNKFDGQEHKFFSVEDFIFDIQKDGRAFELLCVLLHMEETVSTAQKKTIYNIFIQPTHALTIKNLRQIVNQEFPGKGEGYLLKTIWYNESAIEISRRTYKWLLLTTLLCITLFTLMELKVKIIPYSNLMRIDQVFIFSIYLMVGTLMIYVLCYYNVFFRLLDTFHWLKDLMRKNCENVASSLQDGLETLHRHRERLSAMDSEFEINTHLLTLATEIAKYKYRNVKDVADYLEFLKLPIELEEEFSQEDEKQSAKFNLFKDKTKSYFKNDTGRKLESTIYEDEVQYLQEKKGKIRNQHINNESAIMINSTKNIISILKEEENILKKAILLEEKNLEDRRKMKDYKQEVEIRRKGFSYLLSILETRGNEALKDIEINQFLEWTGLNKQDRFQKPEIIQLAIDKLISVQNLQGDFAMGSNHNHSISINNSAIHGSGITAGDGNTTSVEFQQTTVPQPQSVDIKAEVAALREVLLHLQAPDQGKIERALEDIEEELKKPEPDKDEVGQALERAVNYAQKANGFAEAIDKLRPHVEKAAGWLGEHWYKLLPLVGLTV